MKTTIRLTIHRLLLCVTFAMIAVSPLQAQRQWTRVTTFTNVVLTSLAFGKDQFVAAGYDSHFVGNTAVSADGKTWSELLQAPWQTYVRVTFIHDRFFAFGDLGAFTSRDGRNWQPVLFPSGFEAGTVASDGSKYVALGTTDVRLSAAYATSTNAVDWVVSSFRILMSPAQDSIYAQWNVGGFTNRQFIAVGGGGKFRAPAYVLNSADGETWNLGSVDIAGSAPSRVAAGPNGIIVVSGSVGGGNGFLERLWGPSDDGFYFGSGSVKQFTESPDLIYGNGLFLATAGTSVLSSVDGLAWSLEGTIPAPGDTDFAPVAAGNGMFIAAAGDSIYFSPYDGTPRLAAPRPWELGISASGLPNRQLRIEVSTDLRHWQSVATSSTGRVDYSGPIDSRSESARFYRAASE